MDLNLAGRNAFVTGASRGIGLAIVEAFASEEMNVVMFARNTSECEDVAEGIRKTSKGNVHVVGIDLTDPDFIEASVLKAAELVGGTVDVLVNCAGETIRGRFTDLPIDSWATSIAVKPLGLISMSKETLPFLQKSDQPRIINVAGTRGREPSPFSSVSGPVNMATMGITKVMANQLGPMGITVNVINPGSTYSRRYDELLRLTGEALNCSEEEAEKEVLKEVPLGRVVKQSDVADLAVFLASARAAMISGTAINVDGGRTRSI